MQLLKGDEAAERDIIKQFSANLALLASKSAIEWPNQLGIPSQVAPRSGPAVKTAMPSAWQSVYTQWARRTTENAGAAPGYKYLKYR